MDIATACGIDSPRGRTLRRRGGDVGLSATDADRSSRHESGRDGAAASIAGCQEPATAAGDTSADASRVSSRRAGLCSRCDPREESDRLLAGWPSSSGGLVEHRGGLPNWSFHALALSTRLALGEASDGDLHPLANALVAARGLALKSSPVQRQDNSLQGWSWIDDTFTWVEPTAWALLALKTCRAQGMAAKGCRRAHPRWRGHPAGPCLCDRRLELRQLQRVRQGPARLHSDDGDRAAGAAGSCRTSPSCDTSLDFLEEQAGNHASTRALALSTLALRSHGRSTDARRGRAADVACRVIHQPTCSRPGWRFARSRNLPMMLFAY